MKRQNELYVILAVIVIVIVIAASVFLSLGKNFGFLSGSNSKSKGIATVNTTVSSTTSANTTTLNSTTVLPTNKTGSGTITSGPGSSNPTNNSNSTKLSTTVNTTVTSTSTSTLNSTSTAVQTTIVGGSQCVSGCGSKSTTTIPFTAMVTVSNAITNQKDIEFLNASWSGGSNTFAVNFTITNTMTGNTIANALYNGISGSSNSFTFQLPFSINSIGNTNVNVKITSGSNATSTSNTIFIYPAIVSYVYNGATTPSASSFSTNVLPQTGQLLYLCTGTGYIGSLGTSWTQAESSSTWTSIGYQSNSLCSFTQAGSSSMELAGVGISNALTYTQNVGSNSVSSPYAFPYTVANTSDYTFILVDQVSAASPSISVSPSSGTCSTIEDQQTSTGTQGYAAIEVCNDQNPGTYLATVSYSTSSSADPAGYAVYSVN
jgi:trimeric autotransporter adhesin